jgi:hypothetical protein
MPENNTSLTFRIFQQDTFLREETLTSPVIKIGKLSSSHLRLEDESISRMHAVVEVSNGQVSLIDLGSTVGTWVNGQKINKATLCDGDLITMGELRMELSIHAEEQSLVADAPTVAGPTVAGPTVATAAVAAAAPPPIPAAAPAVSMMAEPEFTSAPVMGATAIEVTSMLGDSVVGVKHVMNPRGGNVSPITYGVFAAGALLLILSSIAFFSGVGTAADNKARFHEHITAKRVAHEFRPSRLSTAFDWMALGGLAGGLMCMTVGLLRIREEKIQPNYRIGQAAGVDLPTTDAPTDDFPLIAPEGDEFVFNFAADWQGQLAQGSQVASLAELAADGRARPSASIPGAWQLAIPSDAQIRVQAGSQNFAIRPVTQPRKQAVPLWSRGNAEILSYVGASAIIVLGFVGLLGTIEPDETTLGGDAFANSHLLAHVQMVAPEDPIAEELEAETGEDGGGTGTAMKEDSGLMGKKDSKRSSGQFASKNRNVPPQLAHKQAMNQARTAGILGIMANQEGGDFASLTASGAISSGIDDRSVYGGLLGSEVGEMAGGWGYGINGVGAGAGGTGYGTIGTGDYGIIGHSDGTGKGYTPGHGEGGIRNHKAKAPILTFGKLNQSGDLSADIIRRYVRRKLARIRHCYEKELLVNGNLSGTVTTQFQISPTGKVQGVSASGFGNTKVESCVAAAIESIQFPKPTDGGYVNVRSYPFTFQPAG